MAQTYFTIPKYNKPDSWNSGQSLYVHKWKTDLRYMYIYIQAEGGKAPNFLIRINTNLILTRDAAVKTARNYPTKRKCKKGSVKTST